MTPDDHQRLSDDTARATIAKINAETERLQKLTPAEYHKMVQEANLAERQERWGSPTVWVPLLVSMIASAAAIGALTITLARSFGWLTS